MKISIPRPCNQAWHEMAPEGDARFCTSCERTVIDLTRATDAAIVSLFQSSQEIPCARFLPSQLDRVLDPEVARPPFSALAFTSLFALLSSCSADPKLNDISVETEIRSLPPQSSPGPSFNPSQTSRDEKCWSPIVLQGRLVAATSGMPIKDGVVAALLSGWPKYEHADTAAVDVDGSFSLALCPTADSTDIAFFTWDQDPLIQTVETKDLDPSRTHTINLGDILLEPRVMMLGQPRIEHRSTWRLR